jgi:hypothetical protein
MNDVLKQTGDTFPKQWGTNNGKAVIADYEMDPDVVAASFRLHPKDAKAAQAAATMKIRIRMGTSCENKPLQEWSPARDGRYGGIPGRPGSV